MTEIIDGVEAFKEYVRFCQLIEYRRYPGELRVRAGRYGLVVKGREADDVLKWLESIKEVKHVVEVKGQVRDEAFFA